MLESFNAWLLSHEDSVQFSAHFDSDPSDDDFEAWFLANGGYIHPFVEIVSALNGNFLRVEEGHTLPSGSTIISCPHDLTLSWPSAHKFHFQHVESPPFAQHVATRLFLMKQFILKERSPWWPYIRNLPQPHQRGSLGTPLWYDDEDLAWLRGTNLEEATRKRERTWRQEHSEVIEDLFPGDQDGEERKAWSWDLYLWAATIVSSRAFPGSAIHHANGRHENNGCATLIPGLDLLNHSPTAKVAWLWNSNTCAIQIDEQMDGETQIWNNYGPKANEELLLGYGFCLPNNLADRISLGFSPAVTEYIKATKATQVAQSLDYEQIQGERLRKATGTRIGKGNNSGPERVSQLETGSPAVQDIHWVRLLHNGPGKPRCDFSSGFLEEFSIAVENRRERLKTRNLTGFEMNIWDTFFSRNKLHVLSAVIMILQRKQRAIRKHNIDLPQRPENSKQENAALYRHGQLRILDGTLGSLCTVLRDVTGAEPKDLRDKRIIRLEYIQAESPKELVKDLRGILNAGLQTRDPKKIKERGGVEFAFTIWVCGVWIYEKSGITALEEEANSGSSLNPFLFRWLRFLHETYKFPDSDGLPGRNEEHEELDALKSALSNDDDAEGDPAMIAASYLDAIHVATERRPRSLYNDPRITVERLEWCLNIVRQEGVWCPHIGERAGEDDDEWILYLESDNNLGSQPQNSEREKGRPASKYQRQGNDPNVT